MKLEQRYVVLKISDIAKYIPGYKLPILQELICDTINQCRKNDGKRPIECIVIEKDWPEYEPTLKLLSERVDREDAARENIAYSGVPSY